MFTIVGTPESTERALMLLYSQLESEKERRELHRPFIQLTTGVRGVSQPADSGDA